MMDRIAVAAAWLVMAATAAIPAGAQTKAVKCGRIYQDRPCADGQGRMVGATQAQKAVGTRHEVDPLCQRRGADAQKIIQARVEGTTEDQALAATVSPAGQRLIREVYQFHGEPAEQRAGVENACMAERRRLAKGH